MLRTATALLLFACVSPVYADTLTEPSGVVSVDVPGEWRIRAGEDYFQELESWDGALEIGGRRVSTRLLMQHRPRYTRPELALEVPFFASDEVYLDAYARSGDGFAEVATQPRKAGAAQPWVEWRRAVACNGIVYMVSLYVDRKEPAALSLDDIRDAVRTVLDSVAVQEGGAAPRPLLRDGWWTREVEGFVVVSDVKQKARAKAVARKAAIARTIAAKALPGDPFDSSKPIIWAFADSTSYRTFVERYGGDAKLPAAFPAMAGVLAVELAREENDADDTQYWDTIRRQAAFQYAWQHFGGVPPTWVGTGIAYYGAIGAESGGRGDKPRTWYVEKGREVVAAIPSLESVLRLRWADIDDVTRVGYELWAWHFYFLHAKGKVPERTAYERYIQVLRETGSPRAAERAFSGADFETLVTSLRRFSKKWR